MTNTEPHDDLPLLDQEALRDLEQQLEGSAAARNFGRDFIDVWDARYAKLAAAIIAQDQAASFDAVLSVKITSMMLGAARLAQLAKDLEETIRNNDMTSAAAALPVLEQCGVQTIDRLHSLI